MVSLRQKIAFGILLALLVCLGAYAAWYSYERHDKLEQAQACDEQLAHPQKPTMSVAPDGTLAPLYSINGCTTVVIPPPLWDLVRGHIVFQHVPQRMKVNPYTLSDILLGRYTFGPTDVGCDQSATTTDCSTLAQPSTPSPTEAIPVGGIVQNPNPPVPAPPGYMAFKDNQFGVIFNAPPDWTPRVLPEGDGTQSMTSPDFSDPLGSMTGAYIHYSVFAPPDGFKGNPNGYMDLLKQGMAWSTTTVSGHAGYVSKDGDGHTMVVAQLGDNEFASVTLVDPGNTYAAVFDEFLQSFQVL